MANNRGFISTIRTRMERNRMGELLVQRGKMTPDQLRFALKTQKETGQCFGSVVRDLNFVSNTDVRYTVMEQMSYRALAAIFTIFLGFSSLNIVTARATPMNNQIEPQSQGVVHNVAYHQNPSDFQRAQRWLQNPLTKSYPNLFGSQEVASQDISAFKKWTSILGRLDDISFQNNKTAQFYALPEVAKIKAVNDYVNKTAYIEDQQNFGKSDYWATPAEFFARGGDCEDFAIAKYAMLKELGIPESQMRLAIVQDKIKDIPHAILIVYTRDGAYVLDNQDKTTKSIDAVTRYRPIYSINAQGWWRHIG